MNSAGMTGDGPKPATPFLLLQRWSAMDRKDAKVLLHSRQACQVHMQPNQGLLRPIDKAEPLSIPTQLEVTTMLLQMILIGSSNNTGVRHRCCPVVLYLRL